MKYITNAIEEMVHGAITHAPQNCFTFASPIQLQQNFVPQVKKFVSKKKYELTI
jgi:hypothetical protein